MRFTISPTVVVFLAAPANLNAYKNMNYIREYKNRFHQLKIYRDAIKSFKNLLVKLNTDENPFTNFSVNNRVQNGSNSNSSSPSVKQEVVYKNRGGDVEQEHRDR